jgi:arylsulfatase A-like enzyme
MSQFTRRRFLAAACGAGLPRLPNIVVILADDLGYGDLSCYNPESRISTPNLDRLAAAGMRFTDAHSPSAVCTPTRYGLLTGRYCWRTSLTSGVLDGFDPPLIERGRLTLPSLLRRRGYSTACVGKWHLGMEWTTREGSTVPRRQNNQFRAGADVDYAKPVREGPRSVGFDWYYGISASLDMSPYCFLENEQTVGIPDVATPEDKDLFLNQAPGVRTAGFRLQDVQPSLIGKARDYILGRRAAARPFFLYLPLTAPHLPVVPNEHYRGRSKAGLYGDFVTEMDAGLGEVLHALDQSGQAGNTLVLFTSDNGGLWHWWDFLESDDRALGKMSARGEYLKRYGHQTNAEFRGAKADIWEGGHRVPLIARWPGVVKPGTVSARLAGLNDVLATCAEIVDERLPAGAGEDSISFLPTLRDPAGGTRQDMVLHSLAGEFALRHGDWKLVMTRGSGGFSTPRAVKPKPGEPSGQLYNLRVDPRETRNLYSEQPQIVKRLTKLLDKYREEGRSRP